MYAIVNKRHTDINAGTEVGMRPVSTFYMYRAHSNSISKDRLVTHN